MNYEKDYVCSCGFVTFERRDLTAHYIKTHVAGQDYEVVEVRRQEHQEPGKPSRAERVAKSRFWKRFNDEKVETLVLVHKFPGPNGYCLMLGDRILAGPGKRESFVKGKR